MKQYRTTNYLATVVCFGTLIGVVLPGCGLFEPREPQEPSQSSSHFDPPTTPEIVITNLQFAITEKHVANYMNCFSDPSRGGRSFKFNPSADGSTLIDWGVADERAYFENLRVSAGETGFANLSLVARNTPIPLDTVRYDYGYTLTFTHTKPGVPTTVAGHMELTLGRDESSSFWSIYEWSDYRDTTDTWSRLKVEFQ